MAQTRKNKILLSHAEAIYRAGVKAALPGPAVKKALVKDLRGFSGKVYLVAAGKAAIPMAKAAVGVLSKRLAEGLVVSHARSKSVPRGCRVIVAGHPLPNSNSVKAARAALAVAGRAERGDLFLFLLSGGASALLCAPVPGLSLAEKIRKTRGWLGSGMAIGKINAARKKLSLIKGGKLALAAFPARVLTLALSDVPGDDPAVIGSGPTFPGGTYRVIASNRQALKAAAVKARDLGYKVQLLRKTIQGEAHLAAKRLALACCQLPAASCMLGGGETTVKIRGKGRGGRNQEMALSAALALEGKEPCAFLAGGTDGRDGPSASAGAGVTDRTVPEARARGLDPGASLRDNDSFGFFAEAVKKKAVCRHLPEEVTGTNVMDLYIGLRGKG